MTRTVIYTKMEKRLANSLILIKIYLHQTYRLYLVYAFVYRHKYMHRIKSVRTGSER